VATPSLLRLNLPQVLEAAEQLARLKLPRQVLEVTLEPALNVLCIRFLKPARVELAEPVHPQVHVYRDQSTRRITAVEVLEPDQLPLAA
jgi:glutamate/tyrosine decarboxylase-like PLP-dependent enzyme